MATQYTAGLSVGQVLTAATMNSIGAAWESYTPVVKGGATTVTTVINYAKYARIQKTVFVNVDVTVTSAGAANGIVSISLPTGLNPVNQNNTRAIGTFMILDAGTAYYIGVAVPTGNTIVGQANNSGNWMGAAAPAFTLANTDQIGMSVMYEVA